MTELATYQPSAQLATITASQDAAVQRLGQWAQSADAAFRVAQRLVESSFVPAQFRGKPVEATAAILAGTEVGLSPMSALRAFDVIQGQAAPRAITLRAVVQSYGHEMVLVESTDTRCIMRGRRKGTTEWQTVRWPIDRAQKLGLVSKDNWKKQPGAMLIARATSELARLIAADAILGIGYSAEEINDGVIPAEEPQPVDEPAPTNVRRMSRTRRQAEPEQQPDEPTDTGEMITDPQMKLLQAHYKDTDRAERLAEGSSVIGRDIESFSELTKDEASRLIEWINRPDPDGA